MCFPSDAAPAAGVIPMPTRGRALEASLAGRRYLGERSRVGCRVSVIDGTQTYPLRTRMRDPLWSFSWGRSGASARELAWSILYDSAHDAALATDWCLDFTAEVISLLPREAFCLTSRDVLDWLYDGRSSSEMLERVLKAS